MRCGLQSPPQSRPNPRGGSTLSSSARSSPHIASSRCASADSWRLSGKCSSPLILTLEVEQGAYRILPALRSGPAVLRPAVLHPGLRCLAALSIAPLSFRVTYRHCSTSRYAPLRNRFGLSVHRCRFAPRSLTAPPAGSPVAPVSGGDDASLARPTFPHQAVSGRGARRRTRRQPPDLPVRVHRRLISIGDPKRTGGHRAERRRSRWSQSVPIIAIASGAGADGHEPQKPRSPRPLHGSRLRRETAARSPAAFPRGPWGA